MNNGNIRADSLLGGLLSEWNKVWGAVLKETHRAEFWSRSCLLIKYSNADAKMGTHFYDVRGMNQSLVVEMAREDRPAF